MTLAQRLYALVTIMALGLATLGGVAYYQIDKAFELAAFGNAPVLTAHSQAGAADESVHEVRMDADVQAPQIGQQRADEAAALHDDALRSLLIVGAAVIALASLGARAVLNDLRRQIGGEPQYAKAVVDRIAAGDLRASVRTEADDRVSVLASVRVETGAAARDQAGAPESVEPIAKPARRTAATPAGATQPAFGELDLDFVNF
ncbi:MAG TPA: hypothetical protein VJ673_04920 [Aromatoleum sp.]|uniref:hypothetical protein n=1 Tax=Aromatoleum sp. TaxID=2307007 RepID=UPI002B470779|nr:hypothetical protein [Aromatoleum sp.]HJV25005.1 hypothetical protein [Aromatoleum sp.]